LSLCRDSRVLDLGCGKGAVAVALARRFGASVCGVDGMSAFIDEARALAESQGVAKQCEFRCGDLRASLDDATFDVVMMLGLGPVLGSPSQTVATLRRAVGEGGHLVIGDAFLAETAVSGTADEPDYFHHAETLRQLAQYGDHLVHEAIDPQGDVDEFNIRATELIRQRADMLAVEHPKLADHLRAYVRRQEAESQLLSETLVCATWLIRRGPD